MKDFSFDIPRSRPPHMLSAVLGADSFFYGLFDSEHQLYSCVYHEDFGYDAAATDALATELSRYKGVPQKLAISTKPYLHLPEGQSSVTAYYPAFDDKSIQSELLPGSNITVYYGLSAQHQQVVDQCMDQPSVRHISTVLQSTLAKSATDQQIYLGLYVEANVAHYVASGPEGLLLYNQFHCGDKTDYLYNTMLMYKVLGLKPAEQPLQLLGRVEQQSDIYDLLYDYIESVNFVDHGQMTISEAKFSGSKHVYQDLYSTMLCE